MIVFVVLSLVVVKLPEVQVADVSVGSIGGDDRVATSGDLASSLPVT